MNIIVNNSPYVFAEHIDLEQVLEQLQIDATKGIALALNEVIIPRSQWQDTKISEGDKVIVIGAVAGG